MSQAEGFGPIDERIRVEASEWFARMRGPDAEASRPAFELWHSIPAHKRAYEQLVGRWEQSAFIGGSATGQARQLSRAGFVSRHPMLSTAAAIIGVVCCGALLLIRDPGATSDTNGRGIYPTARYETKSFPNEVTLGDGSRVRLDRASLVFVSYSRTQRVVRVDHGRARFWALHDQRRPFVVRAGKSEVRADANTFDVAYEGGAAMISAVSGTLSVRAASLAEPARLLFASQRILVPSPEGVPVADHPLIRFGDRSPLMIALDHTSLADAAMQVGRNASSAILFEDDASALQITGTFRSGDIDGLARAAQTMFHLKRRNAGATIVLSRGPSTPAK